MRKLQVWLGMTWKGLDLAAGIGSFIPVPDSGAKTLNRKTDVI